MAGGFSMVTAPPPPTRYLWAWGENNYGQLGVNDTANRSSPTQVGTGSTWAVLTQTGGGLQVASLAIKTDGTLWSWGQNTYGQLGQNNTANFSSPVQVGSGATWSQVSGGYSHVTATKTDGTLWAWGQNNYGQLVQNDTVNRSSPTQVGALTTWLKVVSGYGNSFAIKTDGTLWSWGYNPFGQLGQNDLVYRSSPTQVGAGTTWLSVSIYIQGYHCLATRTDGTLWTWGYNGYGELGQNDVFSRSSPTQVGSGTTWSILPDHAGFSSMAIG